MALFLTPDTRAALGRDPQLLCENRSLFFDRFADPSLKEDARKAWFNRGRAIRVAPDAMRDRAIHFSNSTVLYAQLQARLMVNMAGGVMENAGLCLDRYGMPYIPGSSVKGCARRMALQALHDWCSTGIQPTGDDLCFSSCHTFASPAEMLESVALVFGWTEQEWDSEKTRVSPGTPPNWKSDFAWACGGAGETWRIAASALCSRFNVKIADAPTPWNAMPNYGGCVAFLPAYPNNDPGLDLDIVTCHHGNYYKGDIPIATDTEEPIPVLFPAVAAQKATDYFTFHLQPLRNAEPSLMTHARIWLAAGLETFGLGAKTNAGYGWFDASKTLNDTIILKQKANEHDRVEKMNLQVEIASQAAVTRARLAAKTTLAEALANLTPEQQDDKKIELLSDAQFDTKVRAFCKDAKKGGPTMDEQKAIVRALRAQRINYWEQFKPKATKGDLATVDKAIRALCKSMTLGKMP